MNKLSIILCFISLTIASSCYAMGWHEAATNGNLDELQQLIQTEHQNINQTNIFGDTPLHYAALSDKEDAIIILLDRGALAVINQTNNDDQTPLYLAAASGKETAKKLLQFCQTLKERAPKEMFAFFMAFYEEFGSQSPAHVLPPEMFVKIFEFVKHPSLPLRNTRSKRKKQDDGNSLIPNKRQQKS